MKQRILALLLSAGLCLGIIAAAPALAFSDVSDPEVSEAVEVLCGLGIVSGYSDGDYHPEETLTRAQFCKLAILAEGHGDQVQGSAYRTLFSDVPGSSWAAPYVNLAYEEGLVAGYGDGTFGPDDAVTAGQAVTIALRLLGYTQENIGPFWPEDYMNKANTLGLLDGIDAESGEGLTRGEAALLLYHVLRQTDSSGSDYIDNLCTSKVENAVLLDNDAEAEDGTLGTIQIYANQAVSWYEPESSVPDSLVGRKGTLLLNSSGQVAGFLPDDTTCRVVQLSEAAADGVTSTSGSTYTIASSTTVLLDGEVSTYGDCWYELDGRAQATLYYADSGGINLVVASEAAAYEGVMLTGYYESASPNTASPTSIVLLGIELDVAEDGAPGLSALSVGERITVTLNGSGEITAACSASEQKADVYGVLENDQVALLCGLTAKGDIRTGSAAVGDLVRVTATDIGELSASSVSGGSRYALNVTDGTLGSIPLSEDVKLYERVGTSSVVEIALDDILVDTVAAASIDFYDTNSDGEVCLLLLDDVTGNAYTYGLLSVGQQTGGSGSMTYTNRTVSVENSSGTTQEYITGKTAKSGTMGGIAVNASGTAVGVVTLTEAEVTRSDFSGEDYVVADGIQVPISDQVEVYNQDTDRWITLSAAKSYGASLTVYYSGTLGEDAVVRVVTVGS